MQTTSENRVLVENTYNDVMKTLSSSQRLELAARLLNGVVSENVVDERDEWSDEDLRDFSAASFRNSGE